MGVHVLLPHIGGKLTALGEDFPNATFPRPSSLLFQLPCTAQEEKLSVMTATEEYQGLLPAVMKHFQRLEQELKEYLLRVELIVVERVNDDALYRADPDKILEMPLGRLTDRFGQHCGNTELVRRIRAVRVFRNELAHRGFLDRFDANSLPVGVHELLTKLRPIDAAVRDLPALIGKEIDQLEARAPEVFAKFPFFGVPRDAAELQKLLESPPSA